VYLQTRPETVLERIHQRDRKEELSIPLVRCRTYYAYILTYLKCYRVQLSSRIPPGVSRQAQRAIHQLRLNRLSSTASYQALIGQIESPTCPHCGNGDETAEHLLSLCPKWAAERQRYFVDSTDITDVFQDYESLVEFLISSGHLSPHVGSA